MTFVSLVDNSGYIKINFISDDSVAAAMNEASKDVGAPSTASPILMGGYTYPILDDLAQGATYQILKAALPKDSSVAQSNQLQSLITQPETIYSYVDGGDVTIVQIQGWKRSDTPLSGMGWTISASNKTFKRLKTLNRPFRLHNKMTRALRVYIVNDDAYTNEDDLSEFSDEEVERLLDGAFVISRDLFTDCLENVQFPQFTADDMRPELMVNHYRSQEYLRQAQFFHAFNARIFGPMHLTGISHDDPLHDNPGMLKGEAFINVSDVCERLGVDVICTRSALKFEVSSRNDTYVLLEPQKAKLEGVNSDFQTMVNLPGLYAEEDLRAWVKNYLLMMFDRLKNNEIMDAWYEMSSPFFNSSARFFDQNDLTTLTKWNARAWLMSGRRITESPWLFEQLASAIAKTLRPTDANKMRFPIPCAVRVQVVSQSFASMAGYDEVVASGTARWSEQLEAIIVNDCDWIEMYRSHGGHDLDDFFVAYWRTMDNQRKIVLVRSPNDLGEYSIMDYVEGDWYPSMTLHSGEVIEFPVVKTDPELWPKRLSEMYAEGQIIYTGLPSQNDPGEKMPPHPYGSRDVMALVTNNRGSASCVGANVNARSLHALSTRQHRQVQLCTMENCIDTGAQGGSADDQAAVMAEAKDIVERIIRDPAIEIDAYVWQTRFASIFGIPFDRSRLVNDTHISQAHRFRGQAARSFMEMARDFAQKEIAPNPDPLIHRLGKRMLRVGYDVLRATRQQMVHMQDHNEQTLVPGDWGDVHALVLDTIKQYPKESDRHDFVLGLYSACLKAPAATSRRISDQLVMNPHIFPYLLEAMRFYGLAYYLNVSEDGRIVRTKFEVWDLICTQCGTVTETDDPTQVQRYHFYDGVCKACRDLESSTSV
jgi:hypothetical protein